MMRILLTGAAGFIGYHSALRWLREENEVLGFDNLNSYYDPRHKKARLNQLQKFPNFRFVQGDLTDIGSLSKTYREFQPTHVLHLAAQAGVRYSLENPSAYIDSNILGFQNLIDLARHGELQNFVYASSSSVYGMNTELPFSEAQDTSRPMSLYAATKKSNEVVAHCYSHLYSLPTTGLRFFTAYGPFARPDMALYRFATLIEENVPLPLFNFGEMERDFTFVEDIVDGMHAAVRKPQQAAIYNLGRGRGEKLTYMVELLKKNLGKDAQTQLLPMQPGDVPATVADVSRASRDLGYTPKVSMEEGIQQFASWFREHRKAIASW